MKLNATQGGSLLLAHRPTSMRIFGIVCLLVLAVIASTRAVFAATVTIVDGPNTPPAGSNDVSNDGYIQAQLASGNVTIDTGDSTGGGSADEVRVEAGVEITWTTGFSLTLIADQHIVVSGTIQHDGPANGSGGVALLADHDGSDTGDVVLGLGGQPGSVIVGSRHGQTRVDGINVRLHAGDGIGGERFVLLGFRAIDQGPAFEVTGPVSVTARVDVTAEGGDDNLNFVQVGHGSGTFAFSAVVDGAFGGNISIAAGEVISFSGGSANGTYAQVGNGGRLARGNHSGDHLLAASNIFFAAGSVNGAFAHFGNGGDDADGNHSGNHTLTASQRISFTAGSGIGSYAQAGNGGDDADGSHSGSHTLTAGSAITSANAAHIHAGNDIAFVAGTTSDAFAQVGNGGDSAEGDHSGNHHLTADNIFLLAGGEYAQVGNGGASAYGSHSGNHSLIANNDIRFLGGSGGGYAQAGNGGDDADDGTHSGNHTLSAGNDIVFVASTSGGSYVQVGNGGEDADDGNHSGHHSLAAGNHITFTAGSNAYAQVGNGGDDAEGDHSGNHTLTAASGNIVFTGGDSGDSYAQVGNGGLDAEGNDSGDHSLTATSGNIVFRASGGDYAQAGNGGNDAEGNHSGNLALTANNVILNAGRSIDTYAQVGNGGAFASGNHSGTISVTVSGVLSTATGLSGTSYAQVGHGAATGTITGTRIGNIHLLIGDDLVLSGAHIGHVSSDGPAAILAGNTLIGVSQDDPSPAGPGQILASNTPTHTVGFNSAHSPNGELRFYVPESDNVSIPNGTPMNSESFPGAVPADRIAGAFLFPSGPYTAGADYAFYVGSDVPMVQFATSTIGVSENQGSALITATLTFTSPMPVTVTVTSSDDSALAGTDYVAVSQTLTITPGLTSAVLSVAIVNDTEVEPDETFTVTLSNPSGAELGAITSIQVTIRDDDSSSPATLLLPLLRRQDEGLSD